MRILQLNIERGWRGGERQTLLCLRQFRAQGHDVALIARRGDSLARAARDEGFVVHEVGNALGLYAKLLWLARRFDVLHAQTANTLSWLAVLKPVLRRPVVFTRRTAFAVAPEKEARTRWKWQKADVFVSISEAAALEPRRFGLSVVVVPSAIEARPFDMEHARSVAQQFGLQGRKVIATVAALTREKDPCTLIRAVHVLRQKRDDFLVLHLGAGGDAQADAKELVAQLGLQDCYLFTGFQSQAEDFFRLMDVFVLSSTQEALGSSVLDAFLYSVPVVSTDAGGLAELLDEGRGLLCGVGDHDALAHALERVLNDAELRASMVQKAHAYVLEQHDVRQMAQRYVQIYQQVAKTGA